MPGGIQIGKEYARKRSLMHAFNTIDKMIKCLDVSAEIGEKAKSLYKEAQKKNLFHQEAKKPLQQP